MTLPFCLSSSAYRFRTNDWKTRSFFSPPYKVNGDLNSKESDMISSIMFCNKVLSYFFFFTRSANVYLLIRVISWKMISWHFSRTGSSAVMISYGNSTSLYCLTISRSSEV